MKPLLYILILCLFQQAIAQNPGQCKKDLIRSYQALSNEAEINNYEGMHLKYTIQNEYWEKIPVQEQDITYINNLKSGKTLVQTNDHKIFIDKSMAVTINHQKKLIMITAPPREEDKLGAGNRFFKLRDSLLIHSKVQECKPVVMNGQTYREIILQTNATDRVNTHIQNILFWMDEAKHIKKISIQYIQAHQVKAITVFMKKTDYSYTGSVYKGSAYQQVYTKQNTLSPEYEGCRIMDLMKK